MSDICSCGLNLSNAVLVLGIDALKLHEAAHLRLDRAENIKKMNNLIDEMEQYIVENFGDTYNVKPIRILGDMRKGLKNLL